MPPNLRAAEPTCRRIGATNRRGVPAYVLALCVLPSAPVAFLLTDSALIGSMTSLVVAVATGGFGLMMAQRGARQLRRARGGHWNREALRAQTETVGQLTRDAGVVLVKTGAVVLVWAAVAIVVPYERLFVLPVVTLAPAVLVAIVTGRLAGRFRRGLRRRERA